MGRESHLWGNIVSKLSNMDVIERGEFEAFLKSRRALAEFKRELARQNPKPYREYVNDVYFLDALYNAFNWSEANKRLDFWGDLNNERNHILGLE